MADESPICTASKSLTTVVSFSSSSTANDKVWNQIRPPFRKSEQLYDAPRIFLDCPSRIVEHCLEDLVTVRMNGLGEKLWRAGPTPEIASLSQQSVLYRRIQITEDPSVHLLWSGTNGIIYVKPLPSYLTSFAFWEYLLDPSNDNINPEERDRLKTTALGFLKTYASLIQRRSDFNLARRHDLLASFGNTSFEAFVTFISSFDSVPDSAISSRWRYGLLQLDAMNFHSLLILHRWHLNRFKSRYNAYFQRFFPVVLFIFALFSVVLSAMQVILGARQLWDTDNNGLKKTLGSFVWFGTEAIAWSISFGGLFVFWCLGIGTAEACKRRKMKKNVQKRLKDECVGCP